MGIHKSDATRAYCLLPRGSKPNSDPDKPDASKFLLAYKCTYILKTPYNIPMAEESKPKKSSNASKPRKRFIGSKSATPSKPGMAATISHQIPQDILLDEQLNSSIRQLPSNYSFEIHKTIHHVRKNNATMVAMQMPEGLQMYACAIADIIERCAGSAH